ncbi:MAG: serine/threonine protein kinase [Myxococcales bacterium]|nr:serine/threonine protein kinase [Myxococcales bacterium]
MERGEEATDILPRDPAEDAGTEAATPRALAEEGMAGSQAPHGAEPRPSVWATTSKAAGPTAAQALDRADLPRMRMFHFFGVLAPLSAIALSLLIGGDPMARYVFWVGAATMSLANVGLLWLSGKAERWQATPVGVLWIIATTGGVLPMLYYFGPFSAVVMISILGIVFISLGRNRWISLSVAGICIGGHILLSGAILVGWIDDVGVMSSRLVATKFQLLVAEILIVGMQVASYMLGRWARRTNTAAVAELQNAMQVIGDQQQALAEVKDESARQRHADEGRWTGQLMGSYKIGLVLGRGAMGDVYEAMRPDGRSVAIKLLNQKATGNTSLIDRFHREMDLAARLVSPHIVEVIELSAPEAPVPYIAMERLYGTDLATRLRTEPRMPSDELVVLLDQVARGLEVARLAGVVHRDLKPHNLFLHEGSTWKILDFGVSKLVGSEGTLTGEGVVGTPQYMAPEQASGGHVTHLADVYALGAIAYRCLTGRSPFKGKDLSELVYQVVHSPPVRPGLLGRVSTQIEDVLAVAMAKDPRRRFSSAVSFAQAFIAARRGRPLAIDPPPNAWT